MARQQAMTDSFEHQLTSIIKEYEEGLKASSHDDASDVFSLSEITDLQTRCIAAIERASGSNSIYVRRAIKISEEKTHVYRHVAFQIGVLKALLSDMRNGHLTSIEELIHGDLFSDFLEMSHHLLTKGYKDAAAVLAGSTLESHLRNLCKKHQIKISKPNGRSKGSDLLNADLEKNRVYSKLDQKNVTAWIALRNNAAHGKYSEYTRSQVQLLVSSVQDFITRHPA